jgi:hypothetical protein
VPTQLTSELKERRMDAFKELLARYQIEGGAFLQRIVTGDESWAHYFQAGKQSEQRKSGDNQIYRNPNNFV